MIYHMRIGEKGNVNTEIAALAEFWLGADESSLLVFVRN